MSKSAFSFTAVSRALDEVDDLQQENLQLARTHQQLVQTHQQLTQANQTLAQALANTLARLRQVEAENNKLK
jgi:hypothetical protein